MLLLLLFSNVNIIARTTPLSPVTYRNGKLEEEHTSVEHKFYAIYKSTEVKCHVLFVFLRSGSCCQVSALALVSKKSTVLYQVFGYSMSV